MPQQPRRLGHASARRGPTVGPMIDCKRGVKSTMCNFESKCCCRCVVALSDKTLCCQNELQWRKLKSFAACCRTANSIYLLNNDRASSFDGSAIQIAQHYHCRDLPWPDTVRDCDFEFAESWVTLMGGKMIQRASHLQVSVQLQVLRRLLRNWL